MAERIHVIDKTTGKVAISRPEVPAEQANPTVVITEAATEPEKKPVPIDQILPAPAIKRLDKRRCKRAKIEARGLGHKLFKLLALAEELSGIKKRVDVLVAILREAGMDEKSQKLILRSFVNGIIAAGKEVR